MRVSRVSLVALAATLICPGPSEPGAQTAHPRAAPRGEVSDPSGGPSAAPFSAEGQGTPASQSRNGLSEEPLPSDEDLQIIPASRRALPPPLPADLEWLRLPPISLEMLRGQIVLVDVWESSCVNCLRSLAVISRLQAEYSRHRFIALGIHAPEYGFNMSKSAVDRAVRRLGLEFPIASDPRHSLWRAWDVEGWPTTFLLDTEGRVAYLHQGEFTLGAIERRIRRLMREAWPAQRLPPPLAPAPDRDPYAPECGFVTPEIPTRPGLDFLLNQEGGRRGETVIYADPGSARSEGTMYLRGPWSWLHDGLQRGTVPIPATIGITYTAKEVYAVLALAGSAPQIVEVRQDGKWLTKETRGRDIDILYDGRSVLRLGESRLYFLVSNPDVSRHDLELMPQSPSFMIYSFSFGNRCQVDFPHR